MRRKEWRCFETYYGEGGFSGHLTRLMLHNEDEDEDEEGMEVL